MLPISKLYHMKVIVVMIRIIRISSLCLLNQLHTPELGLCQSGFPCSARLVLSVCLHTEESCVNGRVGDMNGEEGWETDPVNADIPTGMSHRRRSRRCFIVPQQKTKGLMTLNCIGAV